MATARIVVMVPQVIERDFYGGSEQLAEWARETVMNEFPEIIPTNHDMGPTDGEYFARIMECCLSEPVPDGSVFLELEDFIAPGVA